METIAVVVPANVVNSVVEAMLLLVYVSQPMPVMEMQAVVAVVEGATVVVTGVFGSGVTTVLLGVNSDVVKGVEVGSADEVMTAGAAVVCMVASAEVATLLLLAADKEVAGGAVDDVGVGTLDIMRAVDGVFGEVGADV